MLHNNVVLMRCFRGDLNKLDLTETDIDEEITTTDEVEELDLDAMEVWEWDTWT